MKLMVEKKSLVEISVDAIVIQRTHQGECLAE